MHNVLAAQEDCDTDVTNLWLCHTNKNKTYVSLTYTKIRLSIKIFSFLYEIFKTVIQSNSWCIIKAFCQGKMDCRVGNVSFSVCFLNRPHWVLVNPIFQHIHLLSKMFLFFGDL